MNDDKHILSWWAEKGHETLPVEWPSSGSHCPWTLLWVDYMGGRGRYWRRRSGSISDSLTCFEAACLIRNSLRVGLEKGRVFVVAENTSKESLAYFVRWHRDPEHTWSYLSTDGTWVREWDDGAARFDESEHDHALTAAWDALQEGKDA